MALCCTKRQRPAAVLVGQIILQTVHNKPHALLVAKLFCKLGSHIMVSLHKLIVGKVSIVAYAQILKWCKQFLVKSFWQTYLGAYLVVKIGEQAHSVHTLWRGRETYEQLRLKLVKNRSVAVSHKVMSLINDNIVIIVVGQAAEDAVKL